MRVLVCGGRNYRNRKAVYAALHALNLEAKEDDAIDCIIHGAAPGADRIAARWATLQGVPQDRYPALWTKYGNAAGPIRNQEMIDSSAPDLVLAFPGGPGTADMVARAKAAGVPVREVAAA